MNPAGATRPPARPAAGQELGADGQARYAWRVLSVTSVGVVLSGLNTSTLDAALPTVARHFGASATEGSWIVLSYMLVNTVMILVFGRVADLIGRRRLYLLGMTGLLLGSAACGFAPDAQALAILRALQAVGAAAIISNTSALLTDAFPPPLLSTGLGMNLSAAASAQMLGPLIGGALASSLGWRSVFWFNVPVASIGLLWARLRLRKDVRKPDREPFDAVGAALVTAVVGGLILTLSESGALGWTSLPALIGAALFAAGLPTFIISQRRRRYPLVDLSLFADRERSIGYSCGFLLAVSRFGVVLLVSLYLQAADGMDPFGAGLRVIPVAGGIALMSPLAGQLVRRFPTRWVASAGMALTALGLVMIALLLGPDRAYPAIGACMFAIGAGTGLFMTPNTSSIMAGVTPGRRGIANGLRSMLQNTGFAVSTALSLAVVTAPLTPAAKRAAYAGNLSTLSPAALAQFTHGYRVAFGILAVACGIGIVASLARSRSMPHDPS